VSILKVTLLRGSLLGGAVIALLSVTSACSSPSADVRSMGGGLPADLAVPYAAASSALERAIAATMNSEGARFTEELLIQERGVTWRMACQGRVTWMPQENAQWTCRNDAVTARSQIAAGLASGSVDEVLEGSTSDIRVVESRLYQTISASGAETFRADLSGPEAGCSSVSRYCTAPGSVLHFLRTTTFKTWSTSDGLRGTFASSHRTSREVTTYSLTVDREGRIEMVSIETLVRIGDSDGRVLQRLTFQDYGLQEPVTAPGS
jgi:hypothetical protein